MKVKSLIIGGGEIGTSLKKVLDKRKNKEKAYLLDIKDKDYKKKIFNLKCEVMHVCFPYSKKFASACLNYILSFEPILVIIHSTIPVGTTSILQKIVGKKVNIVHSPVRGNHPDLEKSLFTFKKYIGTTSIPAYLLAIKELSNMSTVHMGKPETTELGKLMCTSYYGLCIAWFREMERFCKKFHVKFDDAVIEFNKTYNEGYSNLRPNVIRPILSSPGRKKIGGHCVVPNALILSSQIESDFLKLIK